MGIKCNRLAKKNSPKIITLLSFSKVSIAEIEIFACYFGDVFKIKKT